jgi:hypothetical protein
MPLKVNVQQLQSSKSTTYVYCNNVSLISPSKIGQALGRASAKYAVYYQLPMNTVCIVDSILSRHIVFFCWLSPRAGACCRYRQNRVWTQ